MHCSLRRIARHILGIVGTLALTVTASMADSWPQRTVRLVVPVGAGTGPDIAARLFAERLAERWKQPVVVENRPGGDGVVGVTAFVNMHDDHSLLFSFAAPMSVYPATYERLSYDPKRDVIPIASASDTFVALTASLSLKAGSVAEFVALARKQPGKLSCFSAAGAFPYLFLGFAKNMGLDISIVPYRDQNIAVQDLAEGRIHCILSTITTALPAVQSGKARFIAVTNRERAPIAPDVPTAVESGFPDLHFEGLVGFFGPRDLPADRRDRIAADVRAVAAQPVITSRLAAIGQTASAGTPAEFARAIEEQRARMEAIVKSLGNRLAQ